MSFQLTAVYHCLHACLVLYLFLVLCALGGRSGIGRGMLLTCDLQV